MNFLKLLFLYLVFSSCSATVKQDPYSKHTVLKGETVYSIAKKYHVTPFDIYRLNPDSRNGIQEDVILLIPNKSSVNVKKETKNIIHLVKAKETLYGISKQYGVTVEEIKEWNKEALVEGLKTGQEIIVSKEEVVVTDNYVEVQNNAVKTEVFTHKVKAKETLYGIATQYGLKTEELIALNPDTKNGLKEGDLLKIKRQITTETTKVNEINVNIEPLDNKDNGDSLLVEKTKVDLFKTIDRETKKNLVLLLPFNIDKVYSDSSRIRRQYIKGSGFLNLTLDFYAGAKMAIDSAKVLGLPVHVKILNVESDRSSSNVDKLLKENDFSKVDAVIGPFQNVHVESVAKQLAKYNIPVISPLSKEKGEKVLNLYSAVPTEESMMKRLFEYFDEKQGNVIAVVSSKKKSSKDYLTGNYPNVKYPNFTDKGIIDLNSLKSLLVKGQKNFIIVESQTTNQILNVTNYLVKLKEDFDIQMVVLKVYDTLEVADIPITNLTDLKMMFPSNKKEANSKEGILLENKFKQVNKYFPSAYALKGFDVTFDTILRICQEEGFISSSEKYKTEYSENSFDYINDEGTFVNRAVYLMYYDTDFNIKQVK